MARPEWADSDIQPRTATRGLRFIEIEKCDVVSLLQAFLWLENTHGSQGRIGNTHPSQAALGRFAHGQRMASRPAQLPMLSTAFALLILN